MSGSAGATGGAASVGGAGAGPGGAGGAQSGGGQGLAGSDGQAGGGQAGGQGPGGSGEQAGSGGQCAVVTAKPDVDPWSMRLPSVGTGGVVTEKNGAFNDVFLQSPAIGGQPVNYTRIGARLEWGGTLVFFGLGANKASNVLDANDTGREVQVALYDPTRIRQPCAVDASCQTSTVSCGNSITYLGWDPVQGGDECNHGAKVLEHGAKGDALRLVIQPLQWNPDWNRSDCTSSACGAQGVPVDVRYTFELRYLTPEVVELMTEVTSQESISHPVTGQEFPTMYVAHGQNGPDLPLLLDAGGAQPAINTPANDGFFYGDFTSPGPWVTWQNSQQNYGVALGHDQGITSFQGWRGDGKASPYFHNVRAHLAFGLPSGGTVRGLSYLALGGFSTVQGSLNALRARRPPFGHVDLPADGTTTTYVAGQPLAIGGWVLDSDPGSKVRVEIDGAVVSTLSVDTARPDVCAVYPAYPGCPLAGFVGSVPTTGLSACPHLMRVLATDTDGNETVLAERVLAPS